MLHWLFDFFGLSGNGSVYAWWSGAGSDVGEVALIGGIFAGYRRINCHVTRCWRIGKHPVDGSALVVCRKHHPGLPDRITAHHVLVAHQRKASQ